MASSASYGTTFLRKVFWGPSSLEKALPEALQLVSKTQKAIVITGRSLATKTDVIARVEKTLGSSHVKTFSHIQQHAPVADIRKVVDSLKESKADVLIAVGGGSPIDSAKAISYYYHEQDAQSQDFLPIIAIPTTLSVAETTQRAGFTSEEGNKTGVSDPKLSPNVIIYDAQLTLATPLRLWLSTGMRAMDHAVETLYRTGDASILHANVLGAIRELFHLLPACKADPDNVAIRQRLQLACFQSLWPESRNGPLGLSHSLGHALGSTYAIPHGITSCLTLPGAIAIVSQSPATSLQHLFSLSDALDYIPSSFYAHDDAAAPSALSSAPSSLALLKAQANEAELEDAVKQARARGLLVSQAVRTLIDRLGLHSTLKSYDVPPTDLEKIANHVTRGNDAALQQLLVAMLQQKYDDAPTE